MEGRRKTLVCQCANAILTTLAILVLRVMPLCYKPRFAGFPPKCALAFRQRTWRKGEVLAGSHLLLPFFTEIILEKRLSRTCLMRTIQANNKTGKAETSACKGYVLRARVSGEQKAEVLASAARCGMTESDYIRARCLGYNPRQRLTDGQAKALDKLSVCRVDLVNFLNAMRKMTRQEREQIFHHVPSMLQWMKAVNNIATACKEFITEVQAKDCPSRHNKN